MHSSIITHILFFFQEYVDHRDLHSFPTRRSSDLESETQERAEPQPVSPSTDVTRAEPEPEREVREDRAAGEKKPAEERSEEHTSELQSLRHLVCRLLLEKKKKKKTKRCNRAIINS